jgi:hypothetical protein
MPRAEIDGRGGWLLGSVYGVNGGLSELGKVHPRSLDEKGKRTRAIRSLI